MKLMCNTAVHQINRTRMKAKSNQWRNYNFLPPPAANIRYGLTVLIHNSGHFWPPLPFLGSCPPALPGLPMTSYATERNVSPPGNSTSRLRPANSVHQYTTACIRRRTCTTLVRYRHLANVARTYLCG